MFLMEKVVDIDSMFFGRVCTFSILNGRFCQQMLFCPDYSTEESTAEKIACGHIQMGNIKIMPRIEICLRAE
jgi:hypothetical protein